MGVTSPNFISGLPVPGVEYFPVLPPRVKLAAKVNQAKVREVISLKKHVSKFIFVYNHFPNSLLDLLTRPVITKIFFIGS